MVASRIYVLAGTNGAGKSSIGGAVFRARGAEYYNPDEAARKVLALLPHLDSFAANGLAWQEGRRLLERAMAERLDFAFETTLGGTTITELLERAALSGVSVHVWYAGLKNPELHLARVRARVAHGGHDIPEEKIRARYSAGRLNLIRLMPRLTELRVYDNSAEADPWKGHTPTPLLVLHMASGQIITTCDLTSTPDWAKPVMAAALRSSKSR
ncbi:MAG TPA: ZTL protein [Polyangia bacterium]